MKIGILGGVFDPVHFGHLRASVEIYEALSLDEVRFIPCRNPVHKPPALADTKHRVAMLKLAIEDQKNVVIDEREIQRSTPSYMFDTVHAIKNEESEAELYLIIGTDAYLEFTTWHRWEEILDIAQLVVMQRPGYDNTQENNILLQRYVSAKRVHFEAVTPLLISSTTIRNQIKKSACVRYLLPEKVYHYILKHRLYCDA